jgi:hypothetical protein
MPFDGCADLRRGHDEALVREEQADKLDAGSEKPNPARRPEYVVKLLTQGFDPMTQMNWYTSPSSL